MNHNYPLPTISELAPLFVVADELRTMLEAGFGEQPRYSTTSRVKTEAFLQAYQTLNEADDVRMTWDLIASCFGGKDCKKVGFDLQVRSHRFFGPDWITWVHE